MTYVQEFLRLIAPRVIVVWKQKLWPWIRTHKAVAVIAILLVYIIIRPRRNIMASPQDVPHPQEQQSAPLVGSIKGIPLYENDGQQGDEKFGLPASLDTKAIRDFAKQVKQLQSDAQSYFVRRQALQQMYIALAGDNVRQVLFDRINGKGFKDREIPLLWTKISKYNGISGVADLLADSASDGSQWFFLTRRLSAVETNVIAGTPTVGDTLFVSSCQKFFNDETENLNQDFPVVLNFYRRLRKEVPELQLARVEMGGSSSRPATPEEIEATRSELKECDEFRTSYDEHKRWDDVRSSHVENTQRLLLVVNDKKLSDAWAEVVNAKKLPVSYEWSGVTLLDSLPPKVLAGTLTQEDKESLDALHDLILSQVVEADTQNKNQSTFYKLSAQYENVRASLNEHVGYEPPDLWRPY